MSRHDADGRMAAVAELTGILSGRRVLRGDPAVGWAALLEVAAEHQLLSGLWSALRHGGVPELPKELAGGDSPLATMSRRYRTNDRRVTDLRAQLTRVLDALDIAGIDAIPLKGGHWLAAGLLRDPAAREMVDVDVLVPHSLAEDTVAALHRIGYIVDDAPADRESTDHQLSPLRLPGRSGSLEVHLEPMVAFRRALVTADEVRRHADDTAIDRMARRLPDATTAMILLIGHAQLQEDGVRMLQLPLRALHDLQQLDPAFVADVDWDRVERHFTRAGVGGRVALAGFAAAASRHFAIELPVSRTGGASWLRTVELAMDRPRTARRAREVAYLPRALRADRIDRLYGTTTESERWRARLHHMTSGIGTRLRPGRHEQPDDRPPR